MPDSLKWDLNKGFGIIEDDTRLSVSVCVHVFFGVYVCTRVYKCDERVCNPSWELLELTTCMCKVCIVNMKL